MNRPDTGLEKDKFKVFEGSFGPASL